MGKSSKDKRDAFYRLAKEQNWRARSAFKLIQLDEEFDLFSHQHPEKCTRVVDLCAAPGSWSQVLSRTLIKGESLGRRAWLEKETQITIDINGQTDGALPGYDLKVLHPRKNVKVVAIDLQPMATLEGIIQMKADITHPSTVPRMLEALGSDKVDLVISDGAPDVTGLHDLDIYVQAQLLTSALTLAMNVLRPGGKFVAKMFRGHDVEFLDTQLRLVFEKVHISKPGSSRASSLESFVICEAFIPLPGWTPTLGQAPEDIGTDQGAEAKRWIAPFLECGDLSAWDINR
ncbi:putative trna (uridine-2o-)-methyltransferase trm7 [Phaeomoniella chlamydospora]|uniref:Putative tRNA (cytidine(32)/guanosine(34)-2'-O)-methyltransferase n=1 Tax=Phaeomoniella chlamydospora TaxID=158046 RepID=A0A0G2GA56_PHACM|nr:putative trna (uridine-2o-)-methyltransferase trm7 [Phaeomoniella chlamydospora]